MAAMEVSMEELECKICYSQYNLQSRRPKLLDCCHSLCSKCLRKCLTWSPMEGLSHEGAEERNCPFCSVAMSRLSLREWMCFCFQADAKFLQEAILDVGDAFPREAVCPFCRYPTTLRGDCMSELPDNRHLLSALTIHGPAQRNLQVATELLLSPRALTSLVGHSSPLAPSLSSSSSSTTFSSLSSSPSFVLITIMEPRPGPRPTSSLDSLVSMSRSWGTQLWQSWARVLVWVLGLLYFSSLPIGVYLLLLHRPTMGVLMVSLVPASLALVMCYGLCQCLWHELRHCFISNTSLTATQA